MTVFLGGVLAGVGLMVSAFAQSVFTLVITFGLITGKQVLKLLLLMS